MHRATIPELESRLADAIEALRIAEEQATTGRLALEIMHEIRNPLEAVGHLAYLAREDAENGKKVREYMDLAQEQLATVHQIAGQTLGFARVSSSPRSVALVKLAEAALRIHRREIEIKKVQLMKDLPGDVVAAVHLGEMLQVLSNLIVNAIDALPIGGLLSLRVRRCREAVRIVIADNGHGIRAEHSDRIFQPFFTTKGERGTGLGLALSKNIVERHRGKISMRSSVRPGRSGTMFRIHLPA